MKITDELHEFACRIYNANAACDIEDGDAFRTALEAVAERLHPAAQGDAVAWMNPEFLKRLSNYRENVDDGYSHAHAYAFQRTDVDVALYTRPDAERVGVPDGRVERDMTGVVGINWSIGGGLKGLVEGTLIYLYPTERAGVPDDIMRDAARYRYIRRKDAWKEHRLSKQGSIDGVYVSCGNGTGLALDLDRLDAAIDAAMLAAKESP